MNPNPYLPPQTDPVSRPKSPVPAALVGEGGGIGVDFELCKEDLVAFALFHSRPTPEAQRRRLAAIIWIVVLSSVPLAMFIFLPVGQPLFWVLEIGFGCQLIWWMAYLIPWPFLRHRREQQLKKALENTYGEDRYLRLYGPNHIALTSQFVRVSGGLSQDTIRWIAFEKLAVTDGGFYIYNSSNSSVVIPRRAFSSDDHFQTFVQTAQEFHARALAAENPLRTTA